MTLWSRICSALLVMLATASIAQDSRLLSAAQDPAKIDAALALELTVAPARITGVTVPHHILAADLIVRGLRAASGHRPSQIILIGPDHYRSLTTPFGVLSGPIPTAKGMLRSSPHAARLAQNPLFADIEGADREHSIHAVTPFIAALFPDTPVTAITTATASTVADWEEAITALSPLIDADTLIVQSTDYSHFLPRHMAIQHDVQTFGVITGGDATQVSNLNQPAHMDSKAAQYLQMRLQKNMGAGPMIIGHRDAHDYGPVLGQGPTTSYIVTVYSADAAGLSELTYSDHQRITFGGDTFLDRGWRPYLTDGRLDPVLDDIRRAAGPGPLIINLEGVLLPERPAGANPIQHMMRSDLVLPHLKALGVKGANLGNNHSHDFGSAGLSETIAALNGSSITPLTHGKLTEVHGLALLPLTFKRGYFADHPVIRGIDQLDVICDAQTDLPLIVLPHWGDDYTNTPNTLEAAAIQKIASCGASAIIGAHTHLASTQIKSDTTGTVPVAFSMGNLLFDQTGDDVSGALVELRKFQKGSIALRMIPIDPPL